MARIKPTKHRQSNTATATDVIVITDDSFLCNWCNQEFDDRKSIRKHLKTCNEETIKRGSAFIPNKTQMEVESSLNNYFLCHWCKTSFPDKKNIYPHLKKCNGFNVINQTVEKQKKTAKKHNSKRCTHCDMTFQFKRLLKSHLLLVHNIQTPNKHSRRECNVCHQIYQTSGQLKMHIRAVHFNLQAKIPYCEQKKVNQVWFEKVLNCNNVMEIKKIAPNTLVMRKLNEKTAIKVVENNTKMIDLSKLYPIKPLSGTAC